MSLQQETTIKQFASRCARLWKHWPEGTAANRPQNRANYIVRIIHGISGFMVVPQVEFANLSGWGSFSWSRWKLRLNAKYVYKDDIKYGKFVEFCSTIYHETRHAEQFYRIAQGLASGHLAFPDTGRAKVIQEQADTAVGVRGRIAQFGGGRVQRGPAPGVVAASTSALQAKTVSDWLNIPKHVADHAFANKNKFDEFLKLARPEWFQRENTLKEVEDWMRTSYKKTYSEMDSFAQSEHDSDDALRPNVYQMYRSLPEEVDAHGIEDVVQEGIYARLGNKHLPNSRRTEWKVS